MPTIFDELGIRPVINAAGTLTRLGGSLMRSEVVDAMVSAAAANVRIDELEARAGEIIAEITGAESGYVTCGAAAGLLLSAAACMAGGDIVRMNRLPDASGMPNEIVVQRGHRCDYDRALRTAGATFVEVGYAAETMPWEFEAALGERTAAALFVANRPVANLELPLFAKIAQRHNVPVIVDAAGALPPVDNLRRFIREGADLVVFSGGKALQGPQASGFVAGRRDLVASMALQHQDMDVRESVWRAGAGETSGGRPYHGIGRPLKVGKEEICGLLVALRLYAAGDHDSDLQAWILTLRAIAAQVASIPGLTAEVLDSWAGRPRPVLRVTLGDDIPVAASDLVKRLEDGEPRISVNDSLIEQNALLIDPINLSPSHAEVVAHGLAAALSGGA